MRTSNIENSKLNELAKDLIEAETKYGRDSSEANDIHIKLHDERNKVNERRKNR